MKQLKVFSITVISFVLFLVCSCSNITGPKSSVTMSISTQELFNTLASREAVQEQTTIYLRVELYKNDSFFGSVTQNIKKDRESYSASFDDIEVGSVVFAKAYVYSTTMSSEMVYTKQMMYGESNKVILKSNSEELTIQLDYVDDDTAQADITLSALKTAIQNYEPGIYTVYKVVGGMTDSDYDEILNLLNEKLRNEWDWEKYIGLDLSECSKLTKVKWITNLSTLIIPNTVTKLGYDRLYGIQIVSSNPNFVWDNDVLYSKDKTVLYFYSGEKTEETFEIPSGVKSIYPFAFEGANKLKEITIPESVIDIGLRAFSGQKLTFKDKENWISDITGNVLTTEELEKIDNYISYNSESHMSGVCRNGIYKPVIKNVTVENIKEEINSVTLNIHTLFKVSGVMSTNEYKEICELIKSRGQDENWPNDAKGFVGLDLTGVTGFTNLPYVGNYIFSLAIPETISDILNINPHSLAKITNLADNPNFAYEDGILYSNDKTILYSYSRTKEDTSFTIPSTVTIVCNMAFYANFFIQNITIPSSVFYIGEEAFDYTNIKTLTFEDTEGWILYDNDSPLTKSDIENPANYIWDYETQTKGICLGGIYKPQIENITVTASELIEKLKNYEPEMNVYTIYKVTGAMTYNDYIQAFRIPWEKLNNRVWEDKYVGLDLSEAEGLTKIGGTWCFRTVIIPDTVEEIEDYSSGNIVGLESNPNYKYVDDILYTKDGTTLCYYPEDKTETTFTIPSTVTKICSYAFYYNDNLKTITIPENVTYIGEYAINTNLKTLIFSDKNNWYSTNTNQLVSESDLLNPVNYSWNSQTQSAGVCSWGLYKKIIENITVTASELITALNSYEPGTYTIYKVTGAMTYNDYIQAFGIPWEKLNNWVWEDKYVGLDLSEAEGLTKIGGTWCFSTVIIPDTVTEIEDYSRGNIVGLESNPNYKYVDDILYTKDGTTLCYYPEDKTETTFTIPSTVTKICSYAFGNNTSLEKLIIPENVTYIGEYAINTNLKTLIFSDTNNWYNNKKPVSESDLLNPVNYGWNSQTQSTGICAAGIFKVPTQTVTTSELLTALNSYEPGTYTIYKVTGEMTNSDYQEVLDFLWDKVNNKIWDKKYVGLDLSEVSGLTSIGVTWCLFSLVIPDTVTELSDISRDVILNLDSHPNFTFIDGVIYTKDEKTLCSYPSDRTDESFTIPTGVTKIQFNAFSYNSNIKTIVIPETVTTIESWVFTSSSIQTLTFADKEGWKKKTDNQSVSEEDLVNPDNYKHDYETNQDGLLIGGIYK